MRCFIALDLDKEIIDKIIEVQKNIKKNSLFNGKFTEKENLHLTLKFLGEIDEKKLEKVKELLKEIKFSRFDCEIGDIGVFSQKIPRIIWIKLNGKAVYELQKQIDNKLKELFPVEGRFMGHITIARIKEIGDKKGLLDYLDSVRINKIKFNIKEFSLKKSELLRNGPVYTDIEVYDSINNIKMFD